MHSPGHRDESSWCWQLGHYHILLKQRKNPLIGYQQSLKFNIVCRYNFSESVYTKTLQLPLCKCLIAWGDVCLQQTAKEQYLSTISVSSLDETIENLLMTFLCHSDVFRLKRQLSLWLRRSTVHKPTFKGTLQHFGRVCRFVVLPRFRLQDRFTFFQGFMMYTAV